MTFDSIVLAAIAHELNKQLTGGRVDEIHQPAPLDVVVTVRAGNANHMLLISADAESPRIHFTSQKRPNPQTPPNFCMLMRKYLKGARFVGAAQVDFDRILHLNFSAAADGEPLRLIVEIMGKHSSVILANEPGRILGTIKPVGKSKSRYREVLPGRQYVAPPSQNKTNPLAITDEDLRKMTDGVSLADESGIASWLAKTFTGISPFAARELAVRCGGDIGKLPEAFIELFDQVRSGRFAPVLIADGSGHTIGFYAFPSAQYPPGDQHERPSISTVADVYYTTELPKHDFEQGKEDFIRHVRKELEALEQMTGTIREKIAECEGAERLKQIGELILSQTNSILAEAESAELLDYYDPNGRAFTVDLDPKLGPAENAEAYFLKYHKAVTGAEALRDRLTEIEPEIKLLRSALKAAESVTSLEEIAEWLQRLDAKGIRVRKPEAPTQKKKVPEFGGYRVSKVQSNGWEMLVGLNSEANDYLLTRVARPTDIWVHVKASPSAHVIIRANGKPDSVPRTILEAAAELAAKHSDSKHSSLVPVDYTQRKYVRKPKGAPAGKALYVNEKTIFITPRP